MPDGHTYEIEVGGKTYEVHSDKPLDHAALAGVAAKFKKQAAPSRPAVSKTNQGHSRASVVEDWEGRTTLPPARPHPATIGPQRPEPEPNLFQKAIGGIGHILWLPSGAMASAAMQPIGGHSISEALHSGRQKISPGGERMDAANVAALQRMNFFQRANALSGQSLADPNLGRPLAQGVDRATSRAQFHAADVPMRIAGQMETDPTMWLAGPATKALPSRLRPVPTAMFATQAATGSAEALGRYGKTHDPADLLDAGINAAMAGLAARHAHSQVAADVRLRGLAQAIGKAEEGGRKVSPALRDRLASRYEVDPKDLRKRLGKPEHPETKPQSPEPPRVRKVAPKGKSTLRAKKPATTKPAQPTSKPDVANMPPKKRPNATIPAPSTEDRVARQAAAEAEAKAQQADRKIAARAKSEAPDSRPGPADPQAEAIRKERQRMDEAGESLKVRGNLRAEADKPAVAPESKSGPSAEKDPIDVLTRKGKPEPKAKTPSVPKPEVKPAAPKPAKPVSKTNETPEEFHAWVKAQPHNGPRTSAHVLYDRYIQTHPGVTPAQFGQMIHDLPRGEWEVLTSPSGATKFTAKDSTGTPRMITGVRPKGVMGPAIDKAEPGVSRVVRYDEPGAGKPDFRKPHGIYTTPADRDSPHSDLGVRSEYELNPKANAITIPASEGKSVAMRKGAVDAGAGVHAAAHFLGAEEFARIKGMSKADLIKYAQGKYAGVDFSKYHDAQEVVEAIGALEAKKLGYDLFHVKDAADPDFDETVLLTERAVKPAAAPKPAAATPKPRVTRSQKIERLEAAEVIEKDGRFYVKHPGGYELNNKGKPQAFISKAMANLHIKGTLETLRKNHALVKKGPQELGTFNPLRAVLGDERYEDANKKLSDLYHGTRATVNPGGFDKNSRVNALMGRDYLAQREREAQQRETQIKGVRHAFDRVVAKSPGQAIRFMFDVEGGNTHADPAAQTAGDMFRKMLDDKRAEVQKLGTGALTFYIDNYFPHIWKDPVRASQVLGAGKSPLQGSKAFLKMRTIPTIEAGMFPQGAPANLDSMSMNEIKAEVKRQGGLEPLSYNPAEMVQLKLQEQDRYIFGQKWFAEMKARGLTKFVRFGAKAPDGYIKIDDKIARVLQKGPTGMIIRGEWMAPEGAARVMNNHLTPGVGGHPTIGPAFRAINYANNSLNMAQLGLSGFHATTTAMNSIISENARAFDLATSGRPKGALKAAVTAPFAPIRDYWQGSRVLREYRNAGTVGGDIPAIVDSLVKGGGRVTLAREFRLNAMEQFGKAVRQGDVRSMAMNALPAALESTMAPLMRDAVPKMKLGAFAELMRDELQRAGPNATVDQRREIASRAWDSIENRFGQLNYDNLFWDKAFQDAGHLAVRSLGWNLGTLRELGGAIGDVPQTRARLSGGGRVLTPRMAYAMSLVYTTAMAGAIYGYLHGYPPKTLEDYFTPMGPEGKRVQLPTYMKDVRGYASDPIGTVYNKKSPLADIAIETLQNKDFYGKPIRNKEDPAVKQAVEYFRYLGKNMAPFSVRGNKGEGAEAGRERMFGITPVPGKGKPRGRGQSVESLMRGPKL